MNMFMKGTKTVKLSTFVVTYYVYVMINHANSFRPYRSFPEKIINNADQKEGKYSQEPVATPCNIALICMKMIININAIRIKFENWFLATYLDPHPC
jgi:hypothetical protein